HVARVLFMPGRIDDDKAPRRCFEIAPGNVDGDALLALGLKPVEQQAEIDLLAVEPAALRSVRDGRGRVLGDSGRVPEHAADQGRLAVIDRAASEQPQDRAMCLRSLSGRRDVFSQRSDKHQKYPSRFFISMAAAWSWSI